MSDNLQTRLTAAGHTIVRSQPPRYIIRDRYLAFYQFMRDHMAPDDIVLLSDSNDVVFQRDVFEYTSESIASTGDFVILCSEGMLQRESEWNANEQLKLVPQSKGISIPYEEAPVLNGGFIYGVVSALKDYVFLVWATSLFTNNVSDQGVINYLHAHLADDRKYLVASPQTSHYVVTGEAIKQGLFSPVFRDGLIRHPESGEPYCAFHQWNRTNYAGDILDRFRNVPRLC
jgi:hypothetical protein